MEEKIIQITPVAGVCYAQYLYKREGKKDEYLSTLVQLWALVEDKNGNQSVRGMTHMDIKRRVSFCEDNPDFCGYTVNKG